MSRFIIEQKDTCIAVRDTQHPTYEENKAELNSLLEDVVCFFHATFGEWGKRIDEFQIQKVKNLCHHLNTTT